MQLDHLGEVVSSPANSGILDPELCSKGPYIPFSSASLPALQPMSQSSIFSHLNFQFEDAHPGTLEAYIIVPYLFEMLFQLPFFLYLSNHSVPSSISFHIYVFQRCFPALSSWHCSKLFRNNDRVWTIDWSIPACT